MMRSRADWGRKEEVEKEGNTGGERMVKRKADSGEGE